MSDWRASARVASSTRGAAERRAERVDAQALRQVGAVRGAHARAPAGAGLALPLATAPASIVRRSG